MNKPPHDPVQNEAQQIAQAIAARRATGNTPQFPALLEAIDRETRLRMRVYPHRVGEGKMSPQKAAEEILNMEQMRDFLTTAAALLGKVSDCHQAGPLQTDALAFFEKFGHPNLDLFA